MQVRQTGKSDLKLSVLGVGCWAFGGGQYWGDQQQDDVDSVVEAAIDYGINYFDTAEAYNEGRSEESLGIAIKNLHREKLIIGSKVAPSNCHPKALIEACNASLKRLNTDYIDCYMIHWPLTSHSIAHFTSNETLINNPPDLALAMETLGKLKQQGKIRYIGLSNFSKTKLHELTLLGYQVDFNELPYNLLARAVELEAFPYCREHSIGVIGYMTLMQGLLSGQFKSLKDVPTWQRRTRHFDSAGCEHCRHNEAGTEEEAEMALAEIRKIARDCRLTMPELSIKWSIANDAITSVLVGNRNLTDLKSNVNAANSPLLSAEIIQRLNSCTKPLLKKLGSSFDYYETAANDRTI